MKIHDLYKKITDEVIAEFENGTVPWHKPWGTAGGTLGDNALPVRHNGETYSGINLLILWSEAEKRGYDSNGWMTYRQAKKLDANVRKGERCTHIVFAKPAVRYEITDTSKTEKIPYLVYKVYNVFNFDQIDGLPNKYTGNQRNQLNEDERMQRCDLFFSNCNANVRYGGNRAYYSPSMDYIQMPKFNNFHTPESYYGTLAHEMSHWTGHKKRLARSFSKNKFGDTGYAFEELIAELSSSFLCCSLNIESRLREDHAPYVANWLKVLKDNNKAIFSAASFAQRATDYLRDLQPDADLQQVA